MELSEVLENLCSHDRRNPDWVNLYAFDDPEDIREPRKDCFCDNCFYRRDGLALEILRLRGEN